MFETFSFILLFSLFTQLSSASYDIIIYASTPGGIATAITAARTSSNLKIAIIESTAYVGGMVTAGGIGLNDIGLIDTGERSHSINVCLSLILYIVFGSVGFDWIQNNDRYFKVNSSHHVRQPDMEVGQQSFLDLLAVHPNIELILSTGPLLSDGVRMNGTRIVQVMTTNDQRIWQAKIWIDASYDGDLTRFSGASYTWGRESRDQYNESYAGVLPYQPIGNFLPGFPVKATFDNGTLVPFISPVKVGPVGSADENMMGYSYRLCVTTTKEKQAPFSKPTNYDANDYIILQRYIDSLVLSGKYPSGPPIEMLVSIGKYNGYPPGDKFDICGTQSSAFNSDAINLNVGYVNGTVEDRLRIAQMTEDYILGMFWYILNSSLIPNHTRTTLERYGLCNDQWAENRHIPPQLYIREGLRLVNDNVFTQNHIVSGLCRHDTVALGSWFYDVHVVTRTANGSFANNEGYLGEPIARLNGSTSGPVFEIPYSIMLPRASEVTNLLVPVCHAATHVAYSATRVEPHFMLLGGAAGYAAAYAVMHQPIDVQTINVNYIQNMLINDGILLHFPKGHCDHQTYDSFSS